MSLLVGWMSYLTSLTFYSGRLQTVGQSDSKRYDLREFYNSQKNRKWKLADSEEFLESTNKMCIMANGKEIWSTHDNMGIGIMSFQMGADVDSYSPEFHLKSYEHFRWNVKSDLIKLLRKLDTVRDSTMYHVMFIRDCNPGELNKGLPESIRKRVGSTLLPRINDLKEHQRFSWILVIGPEQTTSSSTPPIKLPFQKHISAWSRGPVNRGSQGSSILGQSLSTNCAEVRLRL